MQINAAAVSDFYFVSPLFQPRQIGLSSRYQHPAAAAADVSNVVVVASLPADASSRIIGLW